MMKKLVVLAFLIGLCSLVIYINSTYYINGSYNVHGSFVSADHIVSHQHLALADVSHYELNNQIKSQNVQALEHDSHIIPCTFDQVYLYKLAITLAKNENKSSIIYLGIGNMEGIRLLDEDNLQIYILSTRTFISSNEHELEKLRKVS